ncbi:MAG: VanZ family protein [Eubacterium sp.]|nr:VanZ family protein [Eubacterium sp.]
MIIFALTAFMLFFIFFMSSFNGDDSSELSSSLLDVILQLLSRFGIGEILTEHMLRKLAHFTEYFVLGSLIFGDWAGFGLKAKRCFVFSLPLGFLIACLDEMSQFLSEGRTPMVKDVFIDFSGFFIACLIITLICCKYRKTPDLS